MHSVADICERQKVLGASFFFSRDSENRSSHLRVFTTIAWQLACYSAEMCHRIVHASRDNPDACATGLRGQLMELIVQPLLELGDKVPQCVIVLDALDECRDVIGASQLVTLLATEMMKIPSLKVVMSSRPEDYLRNVLDSGTIQSLQNVSILHDIAHAVVQGDIYKFLKSTLR